MNPKQPVTEGVSPRPATEDDLSAVLAIEAKVHAAPWTEEHFLNELEKPYGHFLVVTEDETDTQVLGYIVYWILQGECQILNLAVDFPYRGTGLGKRLVRIAVSESLRENCKKVVLDVRKSNVPAIQLYQGIGFAITHLHKEFYSNGEDAYQMTLDLSNSDNFSNVIDF